MFIRQAGLIDKVDSDNLLLALEPEAAAIHCRSLDITEFDSGKEVKEVNMPPNTIYMIVDAGG